MSLPDPTSSSADTAQNPADMANLVRYWRHRYNLERYSTFVADKAVLNQNDFTSLEDPLFWQGTTHDLANALRGFLGRDLSFFEGIYNRLQVMIRVWEAILAKKRQYQASGDISMTQSRENMEATLLCGRLISTRAELIPLTEEQIFREDLLPNSGMGENICSASSIPYPAMDNFQRNPSTQCLISPLFAKSADMMDLDGTILRSQSHLTELPGAFEFRRDLPDSQQPASQNMKKRTLSDRDGHDQHKDGPTRKKARKASTRKRSQRNDHLPLLLPHPQSE